MSIDWGNFVQALLLAPVFIGFTWAVIKADDTDDDDHDEWERGGMG